MEAADGFATFKNHSVGKILPSQEEVVVVPRACVCKNYFCVFIFRRLAEKASAELNGHVLSPTVVEEEEEMDGGLKVLRESADVHLLMYASICCFSKAAQRRRSRHRWSEKFKVKSKSFIGRKR